MEIVLAGSRSQDMLKTDAWCNGNDLWARRGVSEHHQSSQGKAMDQDRKPKRNQL